MEFEVAADIVDDLFFADVEFYVAAYISIHVGSTFQYVYTAYCMTLLVYFCSYLQVIL